MIIHFVLSVALSSLFRLIPLTYIWGSACSFFTLYQACAPLTAVYNLLGGILYIAYMQIAHAKAYSLVYLLRGLPTLIGGCFLHALTREKYSPRFSFLFAIIIPCLCFGLFIFHPHIHGTDYIYSLPWIICPFFYLHKKDFLQSTFIPSPFTRFIKSIAALYAAHSVGTIVQLYTTGPLTHGLYTLLIPQAFFERALLASVCTASWYTIDWTGNFIHRILKKKEYTGIIHKN